MSYELFLFDADETLFDFRLSEQLSLTSLFKSVGVEENHDAIFTTYRSESEKLWKLLEEGKTTKEFLRSERFRLTCAAHGLQLDHEKLGHDYLELLPEHVAVIDHAEMILEYLAAKGEIGILTNGIEHVQKRRLKRSGLEKYISFMAVSEASGFAKPDRRFFEYGVKLAKKFAPVTTVMIGDRLETDIEGGRLFGIDTVWFNPMGLPHTGNHPPTHEIRHLSELRSIM